MENDVQFKHHYNKTVMHDSKLMTLCGIILIVFAYSNGRFEGLWANPKLNVGNCQNGLKTIL